MPKRTIRSLSILLLLGSIILFSTPTIARAQGGRLGVPTAASPIADPARSLPGNAVTPGYVTLSDGKVFRLAEEIRPVSNLLQEASPAGGTAPAPAAGGSSSEPDSGNDPSKAKNRFNLYHEYYRIQNGFNFNTTTAAVTLPIFAGGGSFTFHAPFTYAELPGANPFGIGDVYGRLILMPTKWDIFKQHCDWPFPKVTPIFGTEIYFPTAASTLARDPNGARIETLTLGTAKYRLAPFAGFVWSPAKDWLVIPVYIQDMSIAGDRTFDSINQGKFRLFVQYQNPQGWYMKPEFQVVTDFNNHNRVDMYLAPEIGNVFKGGTVFYVKPGLGLLRNAFARDWGIEFGIRTPF